MEFILSRISITRKCDFCIYHMNGKFSKEESLKGTTGYHLSNCSIINDNGDLTRIYMGNVYFESFCKKIDYLYLDLFCIIKEVEWKKI